MFHVKSINYYLFLLLISLGASFVVVIILPLFGHILIGMVFGCWSCYKASVSVIWTVFLGSVAGSVLSGLVFFDHLISAILFVVATIAGFWGMYFYSLKRTIR